MPSQVIPILQADGDEDSLHIPLIIARPWWRQAAAYVAAGLRICRKDISGLVMLVGLFMLPPLAAVVVGSQPGDAAHWIANVLPWITITLGNISAVLAIEAIDAGKPVIPSEILPAAVRWLPRYLWANGITTVLFWGLFTPAQWAIGKLTDSWGWPSFTVILLLGIPMLFWHVRLVFATYAAIVDDQPGARSVRISIGIAHRRWRMVVAAFVGSVLVEGPVIGPIFLLIQGISNPYVAGGFTWVLIMMMRPIFIATLHEIYEDYRPAAEIAQSRTFVKLTRLQRLRREVSIRRSIVALPEHAEEAS
ncbi:MAG TPA: hypothetical protein VFU69_10050 [Ktedonobacterales bacterium]|nr:hypothetical protein [Ktedonobacterales bacterium]